MTGYDVCKRAFSLFGVSQEAVVCDPGAQSRVLLDIFNQLLLDLKCREVDSLSTELQAEDAQIDALVYGVAMMTALARADRAKNDLFARLYNAKRALALKEVTRIGDVLPKPAEV